MNHLNITDRPLAAPCLTSYRCKGRYGWIMIGARNHDDAMAEALRSSPDAAPAGLEVWNGTRYVPTAPGLGTTLSIPVPINLEASARAAQFIASMPGIDLFDYLADYTENEPRDPMQFNEASMRALVLEDAATVGPEVFLARMFPED